MLLDTTPPRPKPGDLFLERDDSFVSRVIRFMTRSWGEGRSKVSHVGIVVGYGGQVVEAVTPAVRRSVLPEKAAVYRPRQVCGSAVASVAESYVGRKYGIAKILAHALDWILGGPYLFRKLAKMDDYPICSWMVAYSYEEVGVQFGTPPWAADPDSIMDWVESHPTEWECIRKLQ